MTSADATIVWQVELANEKSAAGLFVSAPQPESSTLRNPNDQQADLAIRPVFSTISGNGKKVQASTPGYFKGTDVYLGELQTDAKGRLIVLGGLGVSSSVPPGLPVGFSTPAHPTNNFANNEGWHDDISDGPVSATVTFSGSPPVELKNGWVIVAPPDFSPYNRGITTLYDVAFEAAVQNHWLAAPVVPSYQKDILPIIRAASNYQFTSELGIWKDIPHDWAALGKKANTPLRQQAADKMIGEVPGAIQQFTYTLTQAGNIEKWRTGSFVEDFTSADPPAEITADGLNRASLEQGVGGGFYPGIEAGVIMTYKELYAAPFQITRNPFTHGNRNLTPHAGFITRNMACPWQADFIKCARQTDTTVWWPAQRPISVLVKNGGLHSADWVDGIDSHQAMVDNVLSLGVVQPDGDKLIEKERILPRD
ncbi:LodA/GoxA family CTQ-dependent oxidase [Bradyrhizobium betae]